MFNIVFPNNLSVYEIMWISIVETDRSQMKTWYEVCALHNGYLKRHSHTQNR